MRKGFWALAAIAAACSGGEPEPAPTPTIVESEPAVRTAPEPEALHVFVLDCGTIEISDLNDFSTAGDYAGQTDVFTDTCFLIRHPEGDLLWDLGVPGILATSEPQQQGIYTVSLERTLSEQINALGLSMADIELVSISHSHFDHVGQADQLIGSKWLVHEKEFELMFPQNADPDEAEAANAGQFFAFDGLEREVFTGEYDVFGDGTVVIFETPGHTPGHMALQVVLPETGPVLFTGDLYHRAESRGLARVPRFNFDEAQTRASMVVFEDRADELDARVIIQHEPADIDPLPKPPEALR